MQNVVIMRHMLMPSDDANGVSSISFDGRFHWTKATNNKVVPNYMTANVNDPTVIVVIHVQCM